jgi:predicted ferric reductase
VIIDASHRRWILWSGIIALLSSLAYVFYAVTTPGGPKGGTWAGLAFAFAGTGVIVFECLLSLRKKYPASRMGRVKIWLKAHSWVGLLSFLLILFHIGFQWGGGLASLLMWMFVIITISGIYGLVLQHCLRRAACPRPMPSARRTPTMSSRARGYSARSATT